jgi:hypothetical protein
MPIHIPKVIFRDTLILLVMHRSPRTLGDAHRELAAKTKNLSIREYVGRIDFLASRGLVELTFTYTVYHPLVNLADVVPDGYLPILEKVKGAHRYIYTPE